MAKEIDPVKRLEYLLETEKKEKKYLAAQVKELQHRAAIFESLADELPYYLTPMRPLPMALNEDSNGEKIEEHLVMHISDMHADEIVEPSKVQGIEDYDLKIASLRGERYVKKTLELVQNLNGYHFPTLWILMYGDMTSGEIHNHTPRSYYKNMFDNSIAIARLNSFMIGDLAPKFKEIKIICLSGNHGRRSKKKDYDGAHDNWDYLIYKTIELLCSEMGNVEFIIPDSYSFNIDINNHIFNISHGDDIKSWNSIPFYGIERKTRRITSLHNHPGQKPRYFVMGHFHSGSQIANNLDGETIINGPWLATDPYAYESLGLATEPTQWIHGVHHKYGITWRMKIYLRQDRERRLLKNRRYIV